MDRVELIQRLGATILWRLENEGIFAGSSVLENLRIGDIKAKLDEGKQKITLEIQRCECHRFIGDSKSRCVNCGRPI